MTTQSVRSAQTEQHDRSLPEWLTFGVSLTLLLALVGLVIYDWLVIPTSPPVLSVTQSGPVEQHADQFRVPWTIRNEGGATAESVQVIGEILIVDAVVEDGHQEINFLSGGEEEEGAFLFTHDPQAGQLRLRVSGYKLP